ncbi:MAG TPA: 4-alpha-glucanotransferase [Burkholderiales bacterium]|nr:4-alpha-glucanotransferase [Burkholderiales bacterium]
MHDSLVQLAACYGIAPNYYDIWGKRHHASDESLRALLSAMGVRADTPEAILQAQKDHETQRWHFLIPPVRVVRSHQRPWSIRLNLPPALDGRTLTWHIEEETGRVHRSDLHTGNLHSAERRDVEGDVRIGREWWLDVDLPPGYHKLVLEHEAAGNRECLLVVAPPACFQPPVFDRGGRVWGSSVQLYSLRSDRNWGIGDYGDLATVIEQWGAQGGGIVGVNPLHALYPHNAEHCSPYSPSSRLFKNVLYLAVEAVEEYRDCSAAQKKVRTRTFQKRLKTLRDNELVDYRGVSECKFPVLELLYAHFRKLEEYTPRKQAFRAFQKNGGENLRRHTLFEALQAHFHAADAGVWGWPVWPEEYRDPQSEAVRRFIEAHIDRIEFYEYLQWLADQQLHAARVCAHDSKLSVGLYEDLAVSIDRGGGESWANQDLYAVNASVGAPPDEFNLQGQNWGLPPLIPERLKHARYAPFIATLRATMRHAGALRIDHVMGLARLFWVPPGLDASHGTYVSYPFDDLLGILALESHRHRCLVIGEDLGTVPDEVRHALHAHRVLSYRLLYFERRQDGDFKAPAEYPDEAIVAATTHDLPTLAGWWRGRDIEVRAELDLFPDAAMRDAQWAQRALDRAKLLLALQREGCLPEGLPTDPAATPELPPALAQAIAAYLAAAPAKVEVWQLEDVLSIKEQANLPGTTSEQPNWRRKLPFTLEQVADDERFIALTERLAAQRPASV